VDGSLFTLQSTAIASGNPSAGAAAARCEPSRFESVLRQIAQRVAEGETVTFRPTGNSMVPLIQSRDEVIVSPVDPTRVEVGDIVLTKVAGNIYIHLVKAIEPAKRRVQIGNNRGGVNGWTGFDRVYGIAVSVAGTERPGAKAKVVQQDS
jgi:Peptidase S24-like